jgi:hypothetical protein
VVSKFWDGPQAYLFQNHDKRVVFVNPYEDDLCLIGTTDVPYAGAAEDAAVDDGEVELSALGREPLRDARADARRHPSRLFRRPPAL